MKREKRREELVSNSPKATAYQQANQHSHWPLCPVVLIRPNSDNDWREVRDEEISECQDEFPLSPKLHTLGKLFHLTCGAPVAVDVCISGDLTIPSLYPTLFLILRGMGGRIHKSGRLECSFSERLRLYGHTELSAQEWEGINCSFTALSKVGEAERDNPVQCPSTEAYRLLQRVWRKK